jgi:peptidyl-prolyl cis-trans isomerase D
MLQQMRKYTKSWVASLFLGLLALSFGVWGIADIFRGNTDTSVATVGGEKIPIEYFQRDYRNATREATRLGPLKPAQSKAYGQQVLDGLIDQAAMDDILNRYRVTVTDEMVSARVRSIPAFVGPLGTFDRNQFMRVIDQAGYTENEFIQYVRSALERQQLLDAAGAGLELPEGYARALFNYLNEVRAVEYITVPASVAGAPPTPTDAQLEAYMNAHRDRFSTPEYRQVSFAWIAPEDVSKGVKVTDAQLRQQYEAQKAQYVVAEKRDLEQITYPDLASAQAARAKLQSGTTFADLAKQRSLSPSDIAIGTLTKSDLGERGPAVFALPKDGVTQPIKAPVGYALIHVVSITLGTNKSLADVTEDLQKQIATQLAASKISDIANRYIDENSRGESLEKAATKVGMHVGHVAAVDSRGNTPEGSKAQVPSDPELLAQMFKAEVGEEGDPFQAKSGTTFVVKVEGVRPPKLKPLDAVRAEVTAAWQKEQMVSRLEASARNLANKASNQKGLAGVASSIGATIQKSPALRRPAPRAPQKGPLPNTLLVKVFGAPPGEAVYGPNASGSGYIVARVTGIQHPPAAVLTAAMLRRFGAQIGQQAGQDIGLAVAAAARTKAGVSVNQQTVDRLVGGQES